MIRPGSPRSGTGRRSQQEDQPRPGHDARQPTAAERVRTLVETNASAVLTIPGTELGHSAPESRAVSATGDVLLLVPADSPAAKATVYARDDDLTSVMEITDVAPVTGCR